MLWFNWFQVSFLYDPQTSPFPWQLCDQLQVRIGPQISHHCWASNSQLRLLLKWHFTKTSQGWLVSIPNASIYRPQRPDQLANRLGFFTSHIVCVEPLTVTAKQTQTTTLRCTRRHSSKESDLRGFSSEDEVWNKTKVQPPLNSITLQFL